MANSRGRPPVEEPRNKNVLIRLTEAEHKLVSQAATTEGVSVSTLGREELMRGAKRRIKNASNN